MYCPKMVKFIIYLGISIFLVCLFLEQVEAEEDPAERRGHAKQVFQEKHLVLILVPGLSFEEIEGFITALPLDLQDDLQMAGMSMRTGAGISLNPNHNIITLSTGHRELGLRDWSGYHLTEEIGETFAEDIFREWSGESAQAPIVHPAIFKLQEEWRLKGAMETGPGWLGLKLAEQGIVAKAFGNSDTRDHNQRIAATFIMDDLGQAKGIVGEGILSQNVYFPTGRQTNWEKLSTEVLGTWNSSSSSLTVVELGDLERIFSQKEWMEPTRYRSVLDGWFKEWSAWMEVLVKESEAMHSEAEISVWMLSPMVSNEAGQQGKLLAPFITWEKNQTAGLVTSDTTKQTGIVSNLDVLPSLISFFELGQSEELVGKEMRLDPRSPLDLDLTEGINLKPWLHKVNYLFTIYEKRREIITSYILIVIFFIIASALYWWFYKKSHAAKAIQVMLGAIMLSPIYFLWLTPLIRVLDEWGWILALLLSSIASSLLLYRSVTTPVYLAWIGVLNSATILFDIWQGSQWMKRSFLGYDPLIGARYYGLGNEYAGILLGSSILAVTAIYVWLRREHYVEEGAEGKGIRNKRFFLFLSSAWYLLILFFVAAPQLGTNAGATLASLFTYLASQIILFQYQVNKKWVFGLLAMAGIAFLSLGFLHVRGEHTHVGAAINMLASGDVHSIIEIIKRKWEMNLKLIRVSLWGKLFATSLIVLIFVLFRLKREKLLRFREDPWFNGMRSVILGAVLILLVNDSGIVSAATTMIYATFPFIYLRFSDNDT
jgi:hypothetical protein